ncbi:MAG: hypothetical protein M3R11_12505, partial [Acidobacteriota bacterium]|nr:hypothetical protein [Acidobacteriota bacterium]
MSEAQESTEQNFRNPNIKILLICFVIGTGLIYFFSNPNPQVYYDYTLRVAENLLHGRVGFTEEQPSWLNEFVPFENYYYSVFPFGSVLTMLPFAFLKLIGIIADMPAAFISALTASGICVFLFLISAHYEYSWRKRILLSMGILFGTWMWTNLAFAGAWQLALGFAMLGELGAIYFTVFNRKPLLAGLFFALAFGNRTEILLTAPIFMFLLLRENFERTNAGAKPTKNQKPKAENQTSNTKLSIANRRTPIAKLAAFCAVPFVLGIATLVYNYIRFHSFTDFGYARIPGVLSEPWYRHGIFSIQYIPLNFGEMLVTPWKRVAGFPYITPTGFGGSILWSSPFILFTLRFGARRKVLKYAAWAAIVVLT